MIGYLQDRQKGISNPEVDGKKAPGSFFNTFYCIFRKRAEIS